jgi:hypothetical protein
MFRMVNRSATTWFALLACILLVAPCHEAVEICIGLDGHMGIKAGGSSCCHDAAGGCSGAAALADESAQAGQEDHGCGACFDLPLRSGARIQPSPRPASDNRCPIGLADGFLAAAPTAPTADADDSPTRPPADWPAAGPQSHAARSAVLLI